MMKKDRDLGLIAHAMDSDEGRQYLVYLMTVPIKEASGQPVEPFVYVPKTVEQLKQESDEAKAMMWMRAWVGDHDWKMSDEDVITAYFKKFYGFDSEDYPDIDLKAPDMEAQVEKRWRQIQKKQGRKRKTV